MLSEHYDPPEASDEDAAQPAPVEYVGAPTEYADAQEVPESINFLAKLVAGGILTWTVIAAVAGVLLLACVICAGLAFGWWAFVGG